MSAIVKYWEMVAEEEAEALKAKKKREHLEVGMEQCDLTAEERELLEEDDELYNYLRGLRQQRDADAAAEAEAKEVAARLDEEILEPIYEANNKARTWAEWKATWSTLVSVEEQEAAKFDTFLQLCGWMEEDELTARSAIDTLRDDELRDLYTLERHKHRYLVESQAWVEDWEGEWGTQWSEERRRKEKEKEQYLLREAERARHIREFGVDDEAYKEELRMKATVARIMGTVPASIEYTAATTDSTKEEAGPSEL